MFGYFIGPHIFVSVFFFFYCCYSNQGKLLALKLKKKKFQICTETPLASINIGSTFHNVYNGKG